MALSDKFMSGLGLGEPKKVEEEVKVSSSEPAVESPAKKRPAIYDKFASYKSFDEMSPQHKMYFGPLYKNKSGNRFIDLKNEIADSKTDGETGLFISDWADTIKKHPDLYSAVLDVIPDAKMKADFGTADTDAEDFAHFLYKADDKTLDKIARRYFLEAQKHFK